MLAANTARNKAVCYNGDDNYCGISKDVATIRTNVDTISSNVTTIRTTITKGMIRRRDVIMYVLGYLTAFFVMSLYQSHREVLSLPQLSSSSSSSFDKPMLVGKQESKDNNDASWRVVHIYTGNARDSRAHMLDSIRSDKFWVPVTEYTTNGDDKSRAKAMHNGRKWFAQHGQDVAVAKIVYDNDIDSHVASVDKHTTAAAGTTTRPLYFVDLAANDAIWASNTFALEQHFGWTGICIEPNPIYWHRLASLRRSSNNNGCHLVGAVAGDDHDSTLVNVTLGNHRGSGPFGGIIGPDFDNKNTRSPPQEHYTVSLVSILHKFDAPRVIDYLSLDVEGAEAYILTDQLLKVYRFRLLTIERPKQELQERLHRHGYVQVWSFENGSGDTLWVTKDEKERAVKALAVRPEEMRDHAIIAQ